MNSPIRMKRTTEVRGKLSSMAQIVGPSFVEHRLSQHEGEAEDADRQKDRSPRASWSRSGR